jgi:hypothetical protein
VLDGLSDLFETITCPLGFEGSDRTVAHPKLIFPDFHARLPFPGILENRWKRRNGAIAGFAMGESPGQAGMENE